VSTTLPNLTIAPKPSLRGRASEGAAALNVVAVLAACLTMRWIDLDHLPGINGDEAWYGVQVQQVLRGQAIDWRTPTGNLINPLYSGPLLLVHLWLPPSAFALRCVAAFSGTLTLIANYWLCRKSLGQTTAIVSTVVLALLPINIAYSRFGWDTSQSVLMTLLVIHCSLLASGASGNRTKWLIATAFATAGAVIVHPTNIFVLIVPMVALGLLYCRSLTTRQGPDHHDVRRTKIWFLAGAAAFAGVLVASNVLPDRFASRLIDGQQALAFFIQFGRLFSGATVYRFISGALSGDPPGSLPGIDALHLSDALIWLFAGLAAYGLWRWRRRLGPSDIALLVATPLVILSFYIVAGPYAIAPHFERYALCLVGPVVLLASRGLAWWLAFAHDRLHYGKLVATVMTWLVVANVWSNYFSYMRHTGGNSHLAFRTSTVEPKAAALEYVLNHQHGRQNLTIATHEWWNYWPLKYLASRTANVDVLWWNQLTTPAAVELHGRGKLWNVEFADSTGELEAKRLFQSFGEFDRHTVLDPSGRPILTVFGPSDDSRRKD